MAVYADACARCSEKFAETVRLVLDKRRRCFGESREQTDLDLNFFLVWLEDYWEKKKWVGV
jgi:hypothetical protein